MKMVLSNGLLHRTGMTCGKAVNLYFRCQKPRASRGSRRVACGKPSGNAGMSAVASGACRRQHATFLHEDKHYQPWKDENNDSLTHRG